MYARDADLLTMHSLRSALYLQAAVTALYSLAKDGGGGWTLATMVVAAGAVFVGAALQPTPQMRTGALAFEGFAVAFGIFGVVGGHYVPGTIIAIGMLIRLSSGTAALAFTGTPQPPLQVFGAPVAQTEEPHVPPQPRRSPVPPPTPPVLPTVPAQPGPAASRAASMTILPGR